MKYKKLKKIKKKYVNKNFFICKSNNFNKVYVKSYYIKNM
jgi:hypothetical protein